MKRMLAFLLALLTLLFCACGKGPENVEANDIKAEETPTEGSRPQGTEQPEQLEPGFVPSEIPLPDWLSSGVNPLYTSSPRFDFYGDLIFLAGQGAQDIPAAGYYDTLNDTWHRLELGLEQLPDLELCDISARDDAVWILAKQRDSTADAVNWYLFHCGLSDGSTGCYQIGFYGSEGGTHYNVYSEFRSVLSLGPNRALLFDWPNCYLMDENGAVLDQPDLYGAASGTYLAANGQSYFYAYNDETNEGELRLFDRENLQLGPAIPGDLTGSFVSQQGRFLCSRNDGLCEYDPVSGESSLLFSWLDATLSSSESGFMGTLENSAGNFYYIGNGRLIQVTPTMVKVKEPLILAVFGDSGDAANSYWLETGEISWLLTSDLKDGIVRFNNTDPEYKIQLKFMAYENEQERDRFLIQLATDDTIDLIDTSLLPESALGSGVLADMLPYLDADDTISREDFIPSLLSAMQRDGGLYEYSSRFALMSFAVAAENDPGQEGWTTSYVESLIAGHPDQAAIYPYLSQEGMLDLFVKAASAEFIDWTEGSCCFNDGRFAQWLRFVQALPYGDGVYRPGSSSVLLVPMMNTVNDVPGLLRDYLGGEFSLVGFPSASGTGSYWLRLSNESMPVGEVNTLPCRGESSRVGIMARSDKQEGAWRFIRCMIQSGSTDSLYNGIPVYKETFETLVAAAREQHETSTDTEYVRYPKFTEEDAQQLRDLVYHTDRMVRLDSSLLNIIQSEATAFLEGQKSADEAASQVQSRVSIYVAEQG